MLCNVVAFAPLKDVHLYVKLDSGESRMFDMRPYMQSNFFKLLQKPEYFQRAYLDYGVISWPEGKDISPAPIRLELTAQTCPDDIALRLGWSA